MSEVFVPGTVKPEEDYEELGRLSRKLGIPVPMCFVTVESTMPDGTPHERYQDRSRTWVRNFWNKIYLVSTGTTTAQAAASTPYGAGGLISKDSTGYASGIGSDYTAASLIGGLGESTRGIIVGTDDTAESYEHYNLVAPILHGTTTGKLSFAAQSATVNAYLSLVWTATLVRIMNNNSGGSITIKETGICGYSPGGASFMFCRDVLGASVTVANGGQLTVTYTIELTFPA